MRVLLVDDHKLFLEGLYNLLAVEGVDVVGTAADGFEAIEKARILRPDVIVMDIQMPRCDGITATRLIKAELPHVKIVMLTMSDADEDLFDAIRSGASGYLLKNLDAQEFLQMLSGIMQGVPPLSPRMTARLLAEFAQCAPTRAAAEPAAADSGGLSVRQREVVNLVGQGLSYREVGRRLCLSERTVKYHMAEIQKRLGLNSRSQVIAFAARRGLIL